MRQCFVAWPLATDGICAGVDYGWCASPLSGVCADAGVTPRQCLLRRDVVCITNQSFRAALAATMHVIDPYEVRIGAVSFFKVATRLLHKSCTSVPVLR